MSEPHRFSVRIYYEDTDAAGIVYYANYLKFAERARTEWLRELGHPHRALVEGEGLAFAVRRCAADYVKPARLDDLLSIESRLTAVGGASLDLSQTVTRDGQRLVAIDLTLACLDSRLRPARIPADLRARLKPFLQGG